MQALFKQIGVQHARGVLQQIADPEVALGFVWLELHLGHVLQVSGRLIDDLPIPAGPLEGASSLFLCDSRVLFLSFSLSKGKERNYYAGVTM